MRKLLPYEHQLIEELGITQEEYLDFLAVQFDYSTTPAQRLETPQGEAATIALTMRFDNALQSPLGQGVGTNVGRSLGDVVTGTNPGFTGVP
jgi:hypothetical protein